MVYFAEIPGDNVKIESTDDIDRRMHELEYYYGVRAYNDARVKLLATLPGGLTQERQIQARFDHIRVGKSEEFRAAPDLLNFIQVIDEDDCEVIPPYDPDDPDYEVLILERRLARLEAREASRGGCSKPPT